MNGESNILNPFGRKAICIVLILLAGIGFSFGSAAANSCEGGADCPVCARPTHGHIPGAAADMQNPGCTPDGQNSSCAFEAGPDTDEFHAIVSSVRSYNPLNTGVFRAATDGLDSGLLSAEFISKFPLSDPDGSSPVYLQNQSLLL